MTLPTFIVIGAQKSGTTSLHRYLSSHPQIYMPAVKELDFFVAERTWDRGLEWYEAQFAGAGPGQVCGEADPEYTAFPAFDGVPARIAATCPEAKLIYLVRHPIERMRSQYLHAVSEGVETRPISAAFTSNLGLLTRSLYGLQLDRYLEHFPRERILVITAEALRDDRARTLTAILDFIGVDTAATLGGTDRTHNRSADRRVPRWWVVSAARRPGWGRALGQVRQLTPRRLTGLWTRPPGALETDLAPEAEAWVRQRLRPDLMRLREHVGADFHAWGLLD